MRGEQRTNEALLMDASGRCAISTQATHRDGRAHTLRLGDIARVFRGRTPKCDACPDGAFLLRVGDLRRGFLSWAPRQRSFVPQAEFARFGHLHLRRGDICLTASAHRPQYIGKKVNLIYNLPDIGAMPSGEVMVVRLHPDAVLLPEELLFYLRSDSGYEQMQRRVSGSSAHLYPKDMDDLAVPVVDRTHGAEAVRMYRKAARLHWESVDLERQALGLACRR